MKTFNVNKQADIQTSSKWSISVAFVIFLLAYGLFFFYYFLLVGSEKACNYQLVTMRSSTSCYEAYISNASLIISSILIIVIIAIGLLTKILFSDPVTKKPYIHFLKFYIPISVVALALSTQPIPMGSVALGSTSIEVIVPVFMLCVFWFVFSTLYITFAKRQRLWMAIPGVCIASIVATVGHFYLLNVAEDVAKHHKAFFVEHCEVTAVTTDNKMRCF